MKILIIVKILIIINMKMIIVLLIKIIDFHLLINNMNINNKCNLKT